MFLLFSAAVFGITVKSHRTVVNYEIFNKRKKNIPPRLRQIKGAENWVEYRYNLCVCKKKNKILSNCCLAIVFSSVGFNDHRLKGVRASGNGNYSPNNNQLSKDLFVDYNRSCYFVSTMKQFADNSCAC